MDKIKDLLCKCGLSEEAAGSICEAIETHLANERRTLEEEYTRRTEMAKKICVEETENAKLELARRMQIFCEAKSNQIEQIIARQAQAREGQALSTLEQVKGILEGINISDDGGVKRQIVQLKEQVEALAAERDRALASAKRSTSIANKVLKRNRFIESKLAVAEGARQSGDRRPFSESRNSVPRGGTTGGRIDGSRRSGTPTTTRRTIAENVDVREQRQRTSGHTRPGVMQNGLTPAQIAASLEDGPPV